MKAGHMNFNITIVICNPSPIKGVASELGVSAVDAELSATVAKNVAKTVRLVCVKFEQTLVTDGEASQVVGRPTEGQRKNVAVVNCLGKFKNGIEDIVRPGIHVVVDEALLDVDKLVKSAVSPLMLSIADAVEAIILTLHNEDFSAEEAGSGDADKNCSLYMKELQGFLSRVSADFLADFICKEQGQESGFYRCSSFNVLKFSPKHVLGF